MEADAEAGVESSSMEIGVVVAAAGGCLWTLCLWHVLRKRTSAHCRSGLEDGEAMSLCISVNGDTEKDTDAPEEAEKFFIHLARETLGEKNNAHMPL